MISGSSGSITGSGVSVHVCWGRELSFAGGKV